MSAHTAEMEHRLVGGRIETSNDSDFSKKILIHELEINDKSKLIHTGTTEPYRYWRYISPEGSYGNIAELEFYKKGTPTPYPGKIIVETEHDRPSSHPPGEKAFDGDWLTYFQGLTPDHCRIGIDYGKPEIIEKFRCIPRSDDNGIHTGDQYELFYWKRGKWVSMGQQTGKYHYLRYDHIPQKCLLLLRNLSRGTEERIFTYEDGDQIWW